MRCYIITLGCPKNTVDSEMMAELLRQAGHKLVDSARRADAIIVNTCGFIEAARQESYDTLRELSASKRRQQWLVAAGCLAQRYGDEIRRHAPEVDAIIGTQSWPQIVTLLEQLARPRGAPVTHETTEGTPSDSSLIRSVRRRATMGSSAYIKIADGCDARCAFCAIPLIKGPQRSKPRDEVVREAVELAVEGVREIVLIAQDTTAYGRDLGLNDAFPDLLQAIVEATPDLSWLRVMYAYPQHITDRLIEMMAELPQVCHYLDLPLQHGHPDVLRRMRRPHDIESVYSLIARLRQAMPDLALRSTFIVGFPGETEAEFEGLLALMREIAFDKVGIFAYSAETGTEAARLPDQTPPDVIAARHERAMLAQQEISLQRNRAQIGRELPILIEGVGEGLSIGRSYREAPEIDGVVLLPGEAPLGQIVPARIVSAQEYDLVAELL